MQNLSLFLRRVALRAFVSLSLWGSATVHAQSDAQTNPQSAETANASSKAAAVGAVTGRVTDGTNKVSLGAVTISVVGTSLRTTTNRDGEFVLRRVPAGEQTLEFSYIGYQTKSMTVTVTEAQTARLDAQLGNSTDITYMDAYHVRAARDGQARALNQQHTAQNISNIVSSDFSGQFPDKTIADAVKRLPGVTVETDPDTGGSEGRYITVRGMSAAFNAVSINGVRVGIGNADDTNSRQVPLDVVSAKSADMIIVTKSLRPDQDADSIGGSVEILTRSPLEHKGPSAYVEGALSYRDMLTDYSGDYRFKNPGYEGAFSYGDSIGSKRKWAFIISGNARQITSEKQRVSIGDWYNVAPSDYDWDNVVPGMDPLFAPKTVILQDFFDHTTTAGASAGLDFRPTDNHMFRFNVAYNIRDTDRGRQRQQIYYTNGYEVLPDSSVTGDTYTNLATPGNWLSREIREFYETQSNLNASLNGESHFGDLVITWLAGYNRGQYKNDPDKGIWASFYTDKISDNSYTSYADAPYTPSFTTSADRNDPSLFMIDSVSLGSDTITDNETDLKLDAKYNLTLAGRYEGFIKAGVKARFRGRSNHDTTLDYNPDNYDWTIAGYNSTSGSGAPLTEPSIIAPYRSKGLVRGNYDYGFYIDPKAARAVALDLIANGVLLPDEDNAINSEYYTYSASEDVYSGYVMAQFEFGKFTIMGGLRIETSRIEFKTKEFVDDGSGEVVLVPTSPSRTNTNLMPGLHLRYDFTRRFSVRAAYTQSLARPLFSDLNPRTWVDKTELTISRGNIDLKPTTSQNLDASVEYYLGNVGIVSAGVFYKKLKNNIYTPDGYKVMYEGEEYMLGEPRNAPGGYVYGFELDYEQQYKFLPGILGGLGSSANWTHAESSVKTGIDVNPKIPLFDQVKDTVNAGIFYDKYGFRARLSWLYRSGMLPTSYGLNAYYPQLNRYLAASTSLDFTASYQLTRHWSIYMELQNLLNTPGRAYDGNTTRLDYNEYTGWSGEIGVRWRL